MKVTTALLGAAVKAEVTIKFALLKLLISGNQNQIHCTIRVSKADHPLSKQVFDFDQIPTETGILYATLKHYHIKLI